METFPLETTDEILVNQQILIDQFLGDLGKTFITGLAPSYHDDQYNEQILG